MKQKLKNLFDKVAKHTKKKTVLALGAATVMLGGGAGVAMQMHRVSSPTSQQVRAQTAAQSTPQFTPLAEGEITQPLPKTGLNDGVVYWKHKDYDMIIKTWPCDDGLCASVYSVNEKDPNVRMLMAEFKGYAKEVTTTGPRGQRTTRWEYDPSQVQDWEIQQYCGYQADIKLTKQADGSWSGTITSPFNGGTYGLDVAQRGDNEVKVWGYMTTFPLNLIKLSEKAQRVDDPGPSSCSYNWPTP